MNTARILVTLLLTPALCQTVLAERSEFSGSTTVVAVEVPVNVIRGGEPVRGLTIDDFEVFDRGEPRPLLGFEIIDLEAVLSAAAPAVPAVAQRHFLMLFDLAFSRTKTLLRSIEGGRDLVASLHPTDRVAVAVFGLAGGSRLLLNFTSDHSQVGAVLATLEDVLDRRLKPQDLDNGSTAADPLLLVASEARAVAAEIGRAAGVEFSIAGQMLSELAFQGGGASKAGVPDLQAEAVADYDEMITKEMKGRQRRDALSLAHTLGDLGELAKGIDGRKYLVYFSEGFENYLMEGRGGGSFVQELHRTLTKFRNSGWTVQAVDSAGVRGLGEQFNTTNSLVMIARDTGGDFYQNFSDLGGAMERMLVKTGVTYLLVFQSPEIAQDGSFHPIEVRLRNGRRGELRHRPGYYAPDPAEELTASQRLISDAEMILSGEESGTLGVATLARPFRGAAGDGCDVAVFVEVAGQALAREFAGASLETELFVYALDAAGGVRDFLNQKVRLDAARVEARLGQGGNLKFYGDLHLDPGTYDLRVLVRAGSDGPYALRSVPLTVDDMSRPGPVLLGSVFLDDPSRPTIVVRETTPGTAKAAPYPFRMGQSRYFPAVRPSLAAGRPARLSLMAYGIDGLLLETAVVVRSDGTRVEGEKLEMVGKDAHEGLDQIFFDLRSAGLEPGDYAVRVALVDPRTAQTYTSTALFQLVE